MITPAPAFAEVVVGGGELRGPQTFHYTIPPELAGLVQPGQLVLVPFAARQLHGIVVHITDRSPVDATRPIQSVIWKPRLIHARHVELARWVAVHYGAPVLSAMELMAPPGLARHLESAYVPASRDAGALVPLSAAENRVLTHIRTVARATPADLIRVAGKTAATRGVQRLIRAGLVDREITLRFPEPAGERYVTALAPMVAPPVTVLLARAPRQRALWDVLRAAGAPLPVTEALTRAGAGESALRALVVRGLAGVERRAHAPFLRGPALDRVVEMPAADAVAWQALEASLDREEPSPVVLQGDETERWALYARAITYVLEAGRQAVLVAPDRETATALADYLADRTAGVLADAGRAATDAEQIALWRAARAGEIDVLVGARSALFAPLARLGLIVVEREEDPAHKHRSTPRYHVRACAEQLARLSGCAVVFGAETPSVESFYGVEAERYRFVLTHGAELMRQTRLKVGRGWGMTRPAGYVDVVDLRAAEVVGRYGIVARPLFTELRDTLDGGAGAVLYVNRRGTAALTICRACGHVITCPNCSASMVQHVGAQALVCHSCNARATPPRACPVCGGHWLRLWGYGAEAVAEAVAHLFPQRRVARVDSDVPHAEAAAAVHAFAADPAGRVLVGTQRLLAFGARIRARLLGIVQADIGLRFPDFLAPERVFVTLMRLRRLVTGGHAEGRTIVQTLMPAHPVVEALRLGSYLHFFRAEIAEREREGLPPFRPLARAVYAHADSAAAEREVRRAHRELQAVIASLALSGVGLLGPAPAILAKQRGEYRWQILLLGPDIERLFPLLQYGWTIDADPIELT